MFETSTKVTEMGCVICKPLGNARAKVHVGKLGEIGVVLIGNAKSMGFEPHVHACHIIGHMGTHLVCLRFTNAIRFAANMNILKYCDQSL